MNSYSVNRCIDERDKVVDKVSSFTVVFTGGGSREKEKGGSPRQNL
jgi:hypothetical protein